MFCEKLLFGSFISTGVLTLSKVHYSSSSTCSPAQSSLQMWCSKRSCQQTSAKVFAKLSQVWQVGLSFGTSWDLAGPMRMHLDAFGHVRKFWENCSQFQIFATFVWFLRSYAKTDVTNRFLAIFAPNMLSWSSIQPLYGVFKKDVGSNDM